MEIKKFFQKTGIDICSAKSMFNFLNEHFRYSTMNSWNRMESIANCVKVDEMELASDPYVALRYLEAEEYFTINDMIRDWEALHPGYQVGFNGRSGGYLVLYNKGNMRSIVPDEIDGYDSYEDWKEDLKRYGYRVSDFFRMLRDTTELVRDFDKLCDELRAYTETLGFGKFEIDQMEEAVCRFNDLYGDDLDKLGYSELEMDADGKVYIGEIEQMLSLLEAFQAILKPCKQQGYECRIDLETRNAYLAAKY